jgi:hypothetical protein
MRHHYPKLIGVHHTDSAFHCTFQNVLYAKFVYKFVQLRVFRVPISCTVTSLFEISGERASTIFRMIATERAEAIFPHPERAEAIFPHPFPYL